MPHMTSGPLPMSRTSGAHQSDLTEGQGRRRTANIPAIPPAKGMDEPERRFVIHRTASTALPKAHSKNTIPQSNPRINLMTDIQTLW